MPYIPIKKCWDYIFISEYGGTANEYTCYIKR